MRRQAPRRGRAEARCGLRSKRTSGSNWPFQAARDLDDALAPGTLAAARSQATLRALRSKNKALLTAALTVSG